MGFDLCRAMPSEYEVCTFCDEEANYVEAYPSAAPGTETFLCRACALVRWAYAAHRDDPHNVMTYVLISVALSLDPWFMRK